MSAQKDAAVTMDLNAIDQLFSVGQSIALNARDSDKLLLQSASTDLSLSSVLQLYRSNAGATPFIYFTHNPQSGRVTKYLAYQFIFRNPYTQNGIVNRTVWVTINANERKGVTAQEKTVTRNSNAGVMQAFFTPNLKGTTNPYNCIFAAGQFVKIQIPANSKDAKNVENLNRYAELFEKTVKQINETHAEDETLRNEEIAKMYNMYRAKLNDMVEKKMLITTEALIAEDNGITMALAPHSDLRSGNPFFNYIELAENFGITYIPTVNKVYGLVTPAGSDLGGASEVELGIRNMNANDRSQNPRQEATCYGYVNDDRGQQIPILMRVQDPAYGTNNDTQETRAVTFDRILTERNNPPMFVTGTLMPMVVKAGEQDTNTGRILVSVNISEYRVTQAQNLMQNTLNVSELGDITGLTDDFGASMQTSLDAPDAPVEQEVASPAASANVSVADPDNEYR